MYKYIKNRKFTVLIVFLIGINVVFFINLCVNRAKLEKVYKHTIKTNLNELEESSGKLLHGFLEVEEFIEGREVLEDHDYNEISSKIEKCLINSLIMRDRAYEIVHVEYNFNEEDSGEVWANTYEVSMAFFNLMRIWKLDLDVREKYFENLKKYIENAVVVIKAQNLEFHNSGEINITEFEKLYLNNEIDELEELNMYD